MDIFPLSEQARSQLGYLYRTCSDADTRTRCHMLLLYDEHRHSTEELAQMFMVCEDTVLRAIARYRKGGIAALPNRPHPGRHREYLPEDEELLLQVIRQSPRTFGLDFSNWSLPTLAEYVSSRTGRHMGRHAVADILHAHKINLGRPKLHLTSPDPDYIEKRGS